MIQLDTIYNEDCVAGMKQIPDEFVDLTVTSPPYDNLRTYNGFTFDYKATLDELYRITKRGGVVVWVVRDQTVNGSQTGTSFKQALYAKEIGFNLHDTMIWDKFLFTDVGSCKYRYPQVYEYMFIFTKGTVKTFNPIKDRINKNAGVALHGTIRQEDGSLRKASGIGKKMSDLGIRFNIWRVSPNVGRTTEHPASFPEPLVLDHIRSWSNPGDVVFDPFMGSGTTAKCAIALKRHYLGFEISKEYCEIIKRRIAFEDAPKGITNGADVPSDHQQMKIDF